MLIFNVLWRELGVVIEKIILHTLKNIKNIFLAVLLIKSYVLIINLGSYLLFVEEKNAASKPIELILEEYDYCKKSDKKAFW